MKIVSEKPAHAQHLYSGEPVIINGIRFIPGDGGKPTAFNVTEEQVAMFATTKGFSFYHDDGTFSAPSGQAEHYRPGGISTVTSAPLTAANIGAALASGDLSREDLLQLLGGLPSVGTAPAPTPVSTAPASTPATPNELEDSRKDASEGNKKDAPPVLDDTDAEAVGALEWAEILGLARAYAINVQGLKKVELIPLIVQAAAAKKAAAGPTDQQ